MNRNEFLAIVDAFSIDSYFGGMLAVYKLFAHLICYSKLNDTIETSAFRLHVSRQSPNIHEHQPIMYKTETGWNCQKKKNEFIQKWANKSWIHFIVQMTYNGMESCVSTVKGIILTVNLCVEREKKKAANRNAECLFAKIVLMRYKQMANKSINGINR